MTFRVFAALSLGLSAAILAGCGGSVSTPNAGVAGPGGYPALALRTNATATQVVDLNEKLTRATVKPYGKVWAYAESPTSTVSQIVTVAVGTNLVFKNTDASHKHTAAVLGDASATGAPWPSTFAGGTVASPAGTDISAPGWNTGPILPSGTSATYVANTAGYYMIGCKYHYQYGMRTLIIVQ